MDWILEYFAENEGFLDELLVTLIAGFLVLFARRLVDLLDWVWRRVSGFFGARGKLRQLDREITRLRRTGRWNRPVTRVDRRLQLRVSESKPILLIANQKGGVGKTTLAANLGAYFTLRRDKRVLFVDLDFQGTLSATLRSMAAVDPKDRSRIEEVLKARFQGRRRRLRPFEKPIDLAARRRGMQPADIASPDYPGNLARAAFFDAGPELADLEDWLMMKWVAQRDRSDVRFQLARFLHDKEVQDLFDIAILDAPPRDTTAGVNGFCACTDIVIPARADLYSWEGARRFMEVVTLSHRALAPHARVRGVVGMMTPQQWPDGAAPPPLDRALPSLEQAVLTDPGTRVSRRLLAYWPEGSELKYFGTLPTSGPVADDAGQKITYLTNHPWRERVNEVGDRLNDVLRWKETKALGAD